MSEVHTNVTSDNSGNQIVFHNPAVVAQPASAGKSLTVVGSQVHGVVNKGNPHGGIVFDNPA